MLVPFPGEELFERTIPVMAIIGVVYKPNQPFGNGGKRKLGFAEWGRLEPWRDWSLILAERWVCRRDNIEKIISWNVFKRVGYIEKGKAEQRDTRNSRPRLALALPEKPDDCEQDDQVPPRRRAGGSQKDWTLESRAFVPAHLCKSSAVVAIGVSKSSCVYSSKDLFHG